MLGLEGVVRLGGVALLEEVCHCGVGFGGLLRCRSLRGLQDWSYLSSLLLRFDVFVWRKRKLQLRAQRVLFTVSLHC